MSIHAAPGPLVQCSVCLKVIDSDDWSECSECGERFCTALTCPSSACACAASTEYDSDPTMRGYLLVLRQKAKELGLLTNKKRMTEKPLTAEQEARRMMLTSIVSTMVTECNRMDEIRCGEVYTAADNVSLEDSQRLGIPLR